MPDLPNLLSRLRLVLAPVLLALAFLGAAQAFLWVLIVAFVSDAADGFLARRLGLVSEAGARLDSLADLATWAVLPLACWLLRPDFVVAEWPWIALLVTSLLAPLLLGWIRYGRLTSYHTWGAKLSAVLLAFSLVALFAGAPAWPLRIAAAVALLSQLEEIAITAILPEWTSDVPSVWHAVRLR